MDPMPQSRQQCPVDGHVHFHAVARAAPTLDAAAANFRAQGHASRGLLGAVLLSQTAAERVFEELATSGRAHDWTLTPAGNETESLLARKGAATIAVVCGRQVRAACGLEVLALGTLQTFVDGLPFEQAVEAVQRSGALTVLPWGFGKWLGERGRRVQAMLERLGPQAVFLGDNGGRAALAGVPSLIRRSEQRGFRVLPGSDPLPIACDHERVGAFGFLAEARLTEHAPWHTLREWLMQRSTSPMRYGRACSSLSFAGNQVRLQLSQRRARRCTA